MVSVAATRVDLDRLVQQDAEFLVKLGKAFRAASSALIP
jgi:hypothetical protein